MACLPVCVLKKKKKNILPTDQKQNVSWVPVLQLIRWDP